ncbi:MAG: cysteine desulfurase [Myxococcota bacterium]|jgi:cysteine desulfurase
MRGVTGPVYLDNNATTMVDPRVFQAMTPYFEALYGNAASRTHPFGWTAEEAVDKAREQVAVAIGASAAEIVFTSGATESNNLAIKGIALANREQGNHIITAVTEHKAVLDTCAALERQGFDVTYLVPGTDGLLDPEAVAAAFTEHTILVSVMHANNEIGVVQDIAAIGALCQARGIAFHTDAAQSVGKLPLDMAELPVDLVSISAHKVYGPKGIGALYVRRKRPRLKVEAQIHGGGHERGLRSGTLPVPLIVGMGLAMELAARERVVEAERLLSLRQRLLARIEAAIPDVHVNGHPTERLPGNLNLSVSWVEGEALLMSMTDVAVSSGSACTSASLEASYVLKALGVSDRLAHSSIRFGLGRFTTEAEIDFAVVRLTEVVERLRSLSPLWEMVQRGEDPDAVDWTSA